MTSQGMCCAEATGGREAFDRNVGGLQQLLGPLNAFGVQPLERINAKTAHEVPMQATILNVSQA